MRVAAGVFGFLTLIPVKWL